MKKQFRTVLACLALTTLLAGCGNTNTAPSTPNASETVQTDLTSQQVVNEITEGMDFQNHMTLDAEMLKDYYGIDESILEDYYVQFPMMSFQITEIGVFRVKDEKDVQTVLDAVNKRGEDIGISLYPSLEETYNARVSEAKGNYVLFAIADNAADIQTAFNNVVK